MNKLSQMSPSAVFTRIATAIERLAGMTSPIADWSATDAFVWDPASGLKPVHDVAALPLNLLKGIDLVKTQLERNTHQFADGSAANNVLLWGARGTGKSSVVKAVHKAVNAELAGESRLALVEIHREDIATLPELMSLVRQTKRRVILFCDDLSFDSTDVAYKSLKAALEGGIEGRPENAVFYATSNRRHLMPRDMMENERSTAINPAEAVEEKVSLSDRFGLWLGFHSCDQATYLGIIAGYVEHFELNVAEEDWKADAIAWAQARGARSGRVAWQFTQDLAGRLGRPLKY